MELVTLKIKCYAYTETNTWNEKHPLEFETQYPADKYMQDISSILYELLRFDLNVNPDIRKIKMEVLNKDGSYFTDHEFIIYTDARCVITDYDYAIHSRDIRIGDIVHHFKYKGLTLDEKAQNMYTYQIKDFGQHTETGETMVVYQALYCPFTTYIRPLKMFLSEIDHEKYPKVNQVFRFYKDYRYLTNSYSLVKNN